jgi:hypothetical protein
VSIDTPNTSIKLVLELPAASFVRVRMKASSEEALCPLVEITKLSNVETRVVVAPPIVQQVEGTVVVGWKKMRNNIFWSMFINIESRRKRKLLLCTKER